MPVQEAEADLVRRHTAPISGSPKENSPQQKDDIGVYITLLHRLAKAGIESIDIFLLKNTSKWSLHWYILNQGVKSNKSRVEVTYKLGMHGYSSQSQS
jgi:hypothetical protein